MSRFRLNSSLVIGAMSSGIVDKTVDEDNGAVIRPVNMSPVFGTLDLENARYVYHKHFKRVGRVVRISKRGDFDVVDAPRSDGTFYGTCTWFKESVESSTYEMWRQCVEDIKRSLKK